MKKTSLSTRRMATVGLLSALTIVLGVTGLGLVPIPNLTGRATILHVPVILAGVLEGPLAGGVTGFLFGLYSFLTPSGVIPADPIVRIVPRVLIGVGAAWTYRGFLRVGKEHWGVVMAAVVGTLINVVGFLGLAVLMGYLPAATVLVVLPQSSVELVLAVLLVWVLYKASRRR